MQTASTDNLFQTDAEIEKAAARQAKSVRTAELGWPMRLSSKPLDLAVRYQDGRGEAWTAESGFLVRRLDLESGKTLQLYRGHSGPVTSLAFLRLKHLPSELLLTASWDKSICVWDTRNRALLSRNLNAHTDFVKCLTIIPSLNILVSGGSDKDIRIWDTSQLCNVDANARDTEVQINDEGESSRASLHHTGTGYTPMSPLPFLASLKKHHTRPIERLAWYRLLEKRQNDELQDTSRVILWSADSMGRICSWELWRNNENQRLQHEFRQTWLAHETAVHDIYIGEDEAWTASGDQLATLWCLDPTAAADLPRAIATFPHPDFVQAVLPLPNEVSRGASDLMATGCSDEHVRVWNTSTAVESSTAMSARSASAGHVSTALTASEAYASGCQPAGLLAQVEGHSHAVNRLALWYKLRRYPKNNEADPTSDHDVYLISTGLDNTLRRWHVNEILEGRGNRSGAEAAAEPAVSTKSNPIRKGIKNGMVKETASSMTAEEEAELAELMADDEV